MVTISWRFKNSVKGRSTTTCVSRGSPFWSVPVTRSVNEGSSGCGRSANSFIRGLCAPSIRSTSFYRQTISNSAFSLRFFGVLAVGVHRRLGILDNPDAIFIRIVATCPFHDAPIFSTIRNHRARTQLILLEIAIPTVLGCFIVGLITWKHASAWIGRLHLFLVKAARNFIFFVFFLTIISSSSTITHCVAS